MLGDVQGVCKKKLSTHHRSRHARHWSYDPGRSTDLAWNERHQASHVLGDVCTGAEHLLELLPEGHLNRYLTLDRLVRKFHPVLGT